MPRRARLASGGIAYDVLKLRKDGKPSDILSRRPMERPKDWNKFVSGSDRDSELEALRRSARRPFGSENWMIKIAEQLRLEPKMNSRGRPTRS